MKRILSVFLCLCMLFSLVACDQVPGGQGNNPGWNENGDVPEVTLPDSSAAFSDQSIVTIPQVGEYEERVLLANVPGQGRVLLLDIRPDGTVDYIFCNLPAGSNIRGVTSVADLGIQHYTLTADGTATRQAVEWVAELDSAMQEAVEAYPNRTSDWSMVFHSYDGRILIQAAFYIGTDKKYSVLYKVENGHLRQIPVQLSFTEGGKEYVLDTNQMTGGTIQVGKDEFWTMYNFGIGGMDDPEYLIAYSMDGSYLGMMSMGTEYPVGYSVDEDGQRLYVTRGEGPRTIVDGTDFTVLGQAEAVNYGPARNKDAFYTDEKATAASYLSNSGDGVYYRWIYNNGWGTLRQFRHNPEGAKETKALTVYSLEYDPLIKTAVVEWNQTHTDTTFHYTTAQEEMEGTSLTMEDMITRLNLEILNGEGPDVLVLDGLESIDVMIETGFFYPLDGLDTAGVYPNILKRFTVDNDLYAISAKMTPYLLGRDVEKSVPVTSLKEFADVVETSTDPLDCSHDSATSELYYGAIFYADAADDVFRNWYPAWSRGIWEDGVFHSDVFTEFLTQTGRLVTHYDLDTVDTILEADPDAMINYRYPLTRESHALYCSTDFDPVSEGRGKFVYTLAATGYVGLNACLPSAAYVATVPSVASEIIGIPGHDGTGVAVPSTIAAVLDGTGNEEAGVEFLQILLSDEIQLGQYFAYPNRYSDGYPVKWSCTPVLMELRENKNNQKFDIQNDFRQTLADLEAVLLPGVTYQAAYDAAVDYYEGKLTAREAARQVEEATAIYLAEQRR